jgi:hypothetical protein
MHGWLSLPLPWQVFVALLAPVIGVVAGARGARSNNQLSRWIQYSLAYSIGAVLIAFVYQAAKFPGQYSMGPWAMFVVFVFVLALPATGMPWIITRSLIRLWRGPQELWTREGEAEARERSMGWASAHQTLAQRWAKAHPTAPTSPTSSTRSRKLRHQDRVADERAVCVY